MGKLYTIENIYQKYFFPIKSLIDYYIFLHLNRERSMVMMY